MNPQLSEPVVAAPTEHDLRFREEQAPYPSSPQRGRQFPGWQRLALIVSSAFALAAVIAVSSAGKSYEDRLVDMAFHGSPASHWAGFAGTPSTMKALLADYDQEMAFKAQLGIQKYGSDAEDVLARFGSDDTFQEVIRQYGENVLPVIAYFVKNDLVSIRFAYSAQVKSNEALTAARRAWAELRKKESGVQGLSDGLVEAYGPDSRGRQAIALISRDGHQFLNQFVLDLHGQAMWVQTERALDAVKSLFFSGATELEKKYRRGQELEVSDVMSAGMDVFLFAGVFKAVKVLQSVKGARTVGLVKRTQLLGAPALRGSAMGRFVLKHGASVGTAYLLIRHPSLLSGAFATVGKWLNLPPLLAMLVGWGSVLTVLFLPLLSLLGMALRLGAGVLHVAPKCVQQTRKLLDRRMGRGA